MKILTTLVSLTFPLLLTSFVFLSCGGGGGDDDDLPNPFLVPFKAEEIDKQFQSSADGKRLIYLDRQIEPSSPTVVKVTVAGSEVTKEVVDISSNADFSSDEFAAEITEAVISADGKWVAYLVNGGMPAVVVEEFAGSIKSVLLTADLGAVSLSRLGFSADGLFLHFTGRSRDSAANDSSNKSYLVSLDVGETSLNFSTPVDQVADESTIVQVAEKNYWIIAKRVSEEDTIEVYEFSKSVENSLTLSQGAVKHSGFERSDGHRLYADAKGIYVIVKKSSERDRERSGARLPEEAESSVDNPLSDRKIRGNMKIFDELKYLPLLESSVGPDLVGSSTYQALEPWSISELHSTSSGKYLLVSSTDLYYCEAEIEGVQGVVTGTFSVSQFLLVNTSTNRAIPLILTYDLSGRIHLKITQDPCDDRLRSQQLFDEDLRSGRIYETANGNFLITFESNLQGNPDVYAMTLELGNIDSEELSLSNLEYNSETFETTAFSQN